MKSGLFRRILAMAMMAVMLVGDVIPTVAETVSGGDAAIVDETEAVTDENTENTNDDVNPAQVGTDEEETTVSAEENEISVSDGDVVEIEEEEIPLDDSLTTTLEPVTVDGVTITVSGPKAAFADGTTVSAVAVEPTEVVIAAAEESEQAVVKKYKAFDINLVHDGELVQPLNGEEITVNFEGDMLIPDVNNNEDVAVFHVDEDENLTKMDAAVTEVENEEQESVETVEMTTTHFSTYIVVITGGASEYTVTYKHYADGIQFYKPSTEVVKSNTEKTYTDFREAGKTVGGDDYQLVAVKVIPENGAAVTIDLTTGDDSKNVAIKADTTIEFEYEPIAKSERYENDVIFYDYSITSEKYEWQDVEKTIEFKGEDVGKTIYIKTAGVYEKYTIKQANGDLTVENESGNAFTLDRNENYEVKFENIEYSNFHYAWWNGYKGTTQEYLLSKSSGINSAMTLENADHYLIMGRQGDRPEGWDALNIGGTYGGNANQFHGGSGETAIVQGIVSGLSADLKSVIWGKTSAGKQIVEPGYFSMADCPGKTVYSDGFDLTFDQQGHTYQLYSVKNSTGYGVAETLSKCDKAYSYDEHDYQIGEVSGEFFPLDNMPGAEMSTEGNYPKHNWYFGMRYDFTFRLGDYIGDLCYTFEGDDDLWVFVDGKLVLDLGGIHSTYPTRYGNTKVNNSVDLWETYFGITETQRQEDNWWETYSDKYDPNHEYQVTVLYMERGAYASSCYMEFTLPNAESTVITQDYGTLTLKKTDSKTGAAVAGAGFTLYSDEACTQEVKKEVFSDANGNVMINKLVAGDYYLKETTVPEGYLGTSAVWKVKATEYTVNNHTSVSVQVFDFDGNVITEIKNEPKTKAIDIPFTKVYRYDHSKVLADAKFTLKRNDIIGEIIATEISDEDGYFEFKGLEEGTYFMEEIQAPDGYRTPKEGVGLTINVYEENGELTYKITSNDSEQLYYMAAGNLVKNVKGTSVTITKKWEDANGREIEAPVDEVQVELRRKGTTWDNKVQDVILNKENDWTVTIENLEYESDQGVWTYYIIEKTDIPGYAPEYGDAVIDTAKEGEYSVSLEVINKQELGALVIKKTVDKVELVHGKASFTFKITCPDETVLYRTITFDSEVMDGASKEVTIANLPVGEYVVEELETLRYECQSEVKQTGEVTADVTPVFEYKNKKVFENYYSHTDTKVNAVTFERDKSGNITGSTITQQITSNSDTTNN